MTSPSPTELERIASDLVQVVGRYSNTCPAYVNPWALLALARKSSTSPGVSKSVLRQRRLTEPEIDRLVARYIELRSLRLVAAEFKIDRSTARHHLKARSVPLESPASMTPDQVLVAIEMYGAGQSSAAIARTLGFTNKTVIKELRAAGVTIRQQIGRR